MQKWTISCLAALLMPLGANLGGADETVDNLSVMLDAARKLELAHPENRAVLLEKLETTRAPVAIFFGYVDNGAACEQLADVLSSSGRVGTFECTAIY